MNDGKGAASIRYNTKNRIILMIADEYNVSPFVKKRFGRGFTYNEKDQLIQIDEETGSFGSGTSYCRLKITYNAQNNIDKVVMEFSTDGIWYFHDHTASFRYDDKKNPWYTITSKQMNFQEVFFDDGIMQPLINITGSNIYPPKWHSKNNITYVKIQMDTDVIEVDYHYTYNEDDYPESAEVVTRTSLSRSYLRWKY